ncbi:MAG: hypothetical protein ACREPY_00060 [Rhodanobacteraceae bacterium]
MQWFGRQQRSREDRQRGVLGAGSPDFTVKLRPAINEEFVHLGLFHQSRSNDPGTLPLKISTFGGRSPVQRRASFFRSLRTIEKQKPEIAYTVFVAGKVMD